MKEALNKAQNLIDFINIVANYYDLKSNRPSKMILQILTTGITTAVNISDRAMIEAALKSMTLYDFLMVFAKYYDSVNEKLTVIHKNKITDKIETILKVASVKKK